MSSRTKVASVKGQRGAILLRLSTTPLDTGEAWKTSDSLPRVLEGGWGGDRDVFHERADIAFARAGHREFMEQLRKSNSEISKPRARNERAGIDPLPTAATALGLSQDTGEAWKNSAATVSCHARADARARRR